MVTIPEDYGQVSVVFHQQAALPNGAVFTWGFQNLGNYDAVAAATLVAGILTSSGFHSLWCDDVSPISVDVKLGPNDIGPAASVAYTEAGGESGDVGAAATSLLVRKNTASGGAVNRGRMFIPGQSESAINIGGVVQAATLADAQARSSQLLASLATDNAPMVILHTDNALQPTLVTSLTVEGLVANQRRRQRH